MLVLLKSYKITKLMFLTCRNFLANLTTGLIRFRRQDHGHGQQEQPAEHGPHFGKYDQHFGTLSIGKHFKGVCQRGSTLSTTHWSLLTLITRHSELIFNRDLFSRFCVSKFCSV